MHDSTAPCAGSAAAAQGPTKLQVQCLYCERTVAGAQPCSHLPCAPLGSEDPNSLANQVNHALWQHTIALNSEQAKLQYLSMPLKHPLALAACGLFMLAENQAPREVWWQQAQVGSVDSMHHHCVALILFEATTCIRGALQAMIAASLELDPSASFFSVAEDCFFKYAVAINPRSARAWTNLALSQQCIRADYELVTARILWPTSSSQPSTWRCFARSRLTASIDAPSNATHWTCKAQPAQTTSSSWR